MALLGVAQSTMRPTALALNILVASIVTARFHLAGRVRWRALVPFVVGSIPAAFIGGGISLPDEVYRPLVGAVLLFAAVRFFVTAAAEAPTDDARAADEPNIPLLPALGAGAVIGLLAGLTGTGGGIFLTPLLLVAAWSEPRGAAGISAAFILANSIAGLAGNVSAVRSLPPELPLYLVAVAAGALAGSELGAHRLPSVVLRRALAAVLVIAGLKLIFVG